MVKVRVATNVMKVNEAMAEHNRRTFAGAGVYVLNIMSSPGSGKTTLIERTIAEMKDEMGIGVIEGDVYTTRDAERIEAHGVPVVQINTGGACHLDANVVRDALEDLDLRSLDFLIIENVGNLICPAGYSLGEHDRAIVLSVTEGSDKPAKYPGMFRRCDLALVNKIDLLDRMDEDLAQFTGEISDVNGELLILPVSARTGEGMEAWYDWLRAKIAGRQA